MAGGADLKKAQETGRRVCGDCGEEKVFTLYHTRGATKYYQDESGRVWAGRICPPCATKRKLAKQQVREKLPPSKVFVSRERKKKEID